MAWPFATSVARRLSAAPWRDFIDAARRHALQSYVELERAKNVPWRKVARNDAAHVSRASTRESERGEKYRRRYTIMTRLAWPRSASMFRKSACLLAGHFHGIFQRLAGLSLR